MPKKKAGIGPPFDFRRLGYIPDVEVNDNALRFYDVAQALKRRRQ